LELQILKVDTVLYFVVESSNGGECQLSALAKFLIVKLDIEILQGEVKGDGGFGVREFGSGAAAGNFMEDFNSQSLDFLQFGWI